MVWKNSWNLPRHFSQEPVTGSWPTNWLYRPITYAVAQIGTTYTDYLRLLGKYETVCPGLAHEGNCPIMSTVNWEIYHLHQSFMDNQICHVSSWYGSRVCNRLPLR